MKIHFFGLILSFAIKKEPREERVEREYRRAQLMKEIEQERHKYLQYYG